MATKIKDAEFIADAMRLFQRAAEADSEQRQLALEDMRFWTGEQWDAAMATQRGEEGRPCLTINRVADFVAKVVNEQRREKPSIQVSPVGSGASVETAEVLEGLIRHIQERSNADDVYEDAYQTAVASGLGYWRVTTRYTDDEGFDQEARVERIPNRFSVYCDPDATAPDRSDARHYFVIDDIPKDEFKARYPGADAASLEVLEATGSAPPGWIHADTVRVAEYWRKEETRKAVKSADGTRERAVVKTRVVCSVMSAAEVLEEYEWPGTIIPIVPVIANETQFDGKRLIWGLVRYAKDPQRQYNYQRSATTEAIALAPKAPFIAAEGQIEGQERKWETANVRSWAVLQYKPTSIAGQPAPPPQRNAAEPPIQAMSQEVAMSDNDLKAVTGLYDASLGAAGPEQSARAIVARQNQGGISTLTYSSALARAIRMTGRVLVEIIPKIYDAPRVEHIINPDNSGGRVGLFNSEASGLSPEEAAQALGEQEAVERIYDVGVGRYNVTVSAGAGYQTKRQEAAAGMLTLINSYPAIVPIAGDILARNLDWPGADELADRMQKMLPPQLQPQNGDPRAMVAQLQAQLQQVAAQNQKLVQQLEAATDTILTKKIEAQGRQQIAELNAQTQLIVAELKARTQAAQTQAAQEIEMVRDWHKSAHEEASQAAQHAREHVQEATV